MLLRFQTPGGSLHTFVTKNLLHLEEDALQQREPEIFITGYYFFAAYNDPAVFL